MRAVHGAVVQAQQAGATKLGQQGGMQARPDADLGPVPQPTPGRHPGAAHRLGRDIAPRDTGPQYEQDSGERHTVGNTQPSGPGRMHDATAARNKGMPSASSSSLTFRFSWTTATSGFAAITPHRR